MRSLHARPLDRRRRRHVLPTRALRRRLAPSRSAPLRYRYLKVWLYDLSADGPEEGQDGNGNKWGS